LPGIAGAKNLQPLYEKIAKAIRSVDNNTLIFYEPVTWGGMYELITKEMVIFKYCFVF
jgi:endoglycosylceramidase